jgi:hypothetical protein
VDAGYVAEAPPGSRRYEISDVARRKLLNSWAWTR